MSKIKPDSPETFIPPAANFSCDHAKHPAVTWPLAVSALSNAASSTHADACNQPEDLETVHTAGTSTAETNERNFLATAAAGS